MEKNNKLGVRNLTQDEMLENNGGWGWIASAAIGVVSFAYQLGKDSNHMHPESLI